MLVTDPRLIEPGYQVCLTDEDRLGLGLASDCEPVIYCTLTLAEDGEITANLLGPLVINPETRQGRQLVLSESGYTTRHPVARITAGGDADSCLS